MSFQYRKSEYAFSTWTLNELPLKEALDVLYRYDFHYLELWASVEHLDPRLGADLGQVREWLKRNSQTVHSLHAPILHPFPHPQQESEFLPYRMDLYRKTLDACAEFEAPIMVLHAYDAHYYPHQNTPSEIAVVHECLEQLTRYAKVRGVRVAIENMPDVWHGTELLTTLANQKKLFGDLDVYYCLDIGHVPVMGQTTCEAEIDAVADRLITFHVHNNRGVLDDHNLPDDGVLDWPAIHDYARAKGYQGDFVLELRGAKNQEDTVRQAAALFS